MITRLRLLTLPACLVVCAVDASPAGGAVPLRAPIVVDGSFADWDEVRTNASNATVEGQGSGVDCLLSTDRDCPINELDLDLREFAWTWDEANFYFFVDFHGITGGDKWVFLYVDADLDERVSSGEPLVRLRILDDSGSLELGVDSYVAASPGGADPLVDAGGLADGHAMPGRGFGAPLPLTVDVGMTPADPRFEGSRRR
jgi:hypothetical protein